MLWSKKFKFYKNFFCLFFKTKETNAFFSVNCADRIKTLLERNRLSQESQELLRKKQHVFIDGLSTQVILEGFQNHIQKNPDNIIYYYYHSFKFIQLIIILFLL